ncbi:hypothetical protein PP178_04225 [Zeaxanthinibacter sp. PT1]|uniref:hypothetical protein n=1 Tax=Zeaxanthinibacter TaxID=561554 RepID=UPI00234AC03B|nr:hypothetical protein [Zeaxanthinibacter sp. PT1]MDC6350746.1 hypothetical protein [Zeaxanthinibacter sp. PT1]
MDIPSDILKRFVEYCDYQVDDKLFLPHYYQEDMEDVDLGSGHECNNPDTQIVLMHFLHEHKDEKFQIHYRGLDPYWIFHDNRHSLNDVMGCEVYGINSHVERDRLLEGAEMSRDHGVYINPKSAIGVINAWKSRWKFDERTNMASLETSDFQPFMKEEEFDILEMYHEGGYNPDYN